MKLAEHNHSTVAHWLDLDGTLWVTDAMWWIIDREMPERPLFKISQEEGSLSVSGHFKSAALDNMIDYNGIVAWLSPASVEKINKLKLPMSRIGISYREFEDEMHLADQAKSLIVLIQHIKHLDGTNDVVALLTARGNKNGHDFIVQELKKKIVKHGINVSIDKVYFVNDRKLSRHSGASSIKKTYILLEHMVGYRIKNDAFIPVEQEWYGTTNFYDDEALNVAIALGVNDVLNTLISNTDKELAKEIQDSLQEMPRKLIVHAVTSNMENPFISTEIVLSL